MIGKILSRLLGGAGEEEAANTIEELMEFEEGGWIVVNLPGETHRLLSLDYTDDGDDADGDEDVSTAENGPLSASEVDPLENLLIEHPSMSVYQIRRRMSGQEEEEEQQGSDEDEEDTARPVAVRQHVSWRLAAWGVPLPCNIQLLSVQRARTQAERKKLSRGALHRQNLAKLRFSPTEKRYGYFKQPCQRLYNY